MTRQELDNIFSLQTAAVIAAAGHGKTEMIVDMVEYADGKQLLLTHTHAGVDALQKRLNRRSIRSSKYAISTIAAFCTKWGMAYPHTAGIDTALKPYNNKDETKRYYAQFYDGAKHLFQHNWAGMVLQKSYAGIIVDEYQDCLQSHHETFQILSRYLPVRVLGDPLQGIFSFDNQRLVDWSSLGFPVIDVNTSPWRWRNTNPGLGQYLTTVRNELWPTLSGKPCTLDIDSCNGSIRVIDPTAFNVYSMRREFGQYGTVLYLTKWEKQQFKFCQRHPGIFQMDERQECEDLFAFAKSFSNKTGADLMLAVMDFESKCATKVNTELASYRNRLEKGSFNFTIIKKHTDFGQLLISLQHADRQEIILGIHLLLEFEINRYSLGDRCSLYFCLAYIF